MDALENALKKLHSLKRLSIKTDPDKARLDISKKFLNYFFWIIIMILGIAVLQWAVSSFSDKSYCPFNLKEILTIFLTSFTDRVFRKKFERLIAISCAFSGFDIVNDEIEFSAL